MIYKLNSKSIFLPMKKNYGLQNLYNFLRTKT